MGNIGPVVPEETYLADVRKVTEENETLLIFDEVIPASVCVSAGHNAFTG